MNAAIAKYLNLAEELIQEVQTWSRVLWVRVAGVRPRFVSKIGLVMEAQKLFFTNYERGNIYAHLCPLTIEQGSILRGDLYKGVPLDEDDNKKRFFQGKAATVQFDLGTLKNGLYEWKEATGEKTRLYYLKIQDGQIAQDWETFQEMMKAIEQGKKFTPAFSLST